MHLSLVILVLLIVQVKIESKFMFRFTKIQCNSSLKAFTNFNCHLRTYSRRAGPVINVAFTLARSLPNGKLFLEILMRRGGKSGNFERVTYHPDIELCKIVAGDDTNPFISDILGMVKSVAKGLLEVCTRSGEFSAANVSLANVPFISIWPNGDYKTSIRIFDEIDDNIANATYLATISH